MTTTPFTIPEGSGDVILGYIRRKSAEWTVAQMIQRVQEGIVQLEAAANAVPAAALDAVAEGEDWSPLFTIRHVAEINMATVGRCVAAATGKQPTDSPPGLPGDRSGILATHRGFAEASFAALESAAPGQDAATTWPHPFLGELNWREWLLTVRVHCLGHAEQLQKMAS